MEHDLACGRCKGSGTIWNGIQVVRCPGPESGENGELKDLRPLAARQHHEAAAATDASARGHRDIRDELVRELRAEDPKTG